MASRTIGTIFTLRDRMTQPLNTMSEATRRLYRQSQQATNQLNRFASNAQSAFASAASKTAKFALTTGAVLTGLAAKNGLSEAMGLEGYKMQLETATKDTKKASDIMRYAIEMANKTPYEGGELVSAAAKFEAMGLSAKKNLLLAGDMAAATNKGMDQATDALIDARAGELESLKAFGIEKQLIQDQADKMFKKGSTINKKGQIADQEQFNKALEVVMIDRFKGGMDKQALTLKGTWSTITGITKSALSGMLGMTADGTVRAGSLYDKLKIKISEVAKVFEKWQSDGTFDRLGASITKVADGSFRVLGGTIKFVTDNFGWLAPVMAGTVSLFVAMSVINKVVAAYQLLRSILIVTTAAQNGLNVSIAISPLGWVVIAIAAVVAACVALYLHWDKVTAALKSAWDWFKNLIAGMPDVAIGLAGPLAPLILMIKHFDEIKEACSGAINKLKEFFGLSDKKGKTETDGKTQANSDNYGMKGFAKGGIASRPSIFGEAGPEMAIPLNGSSRSRQLLAQTQRILGGGGGGINVTIAKIADQVIVREDADIDKIANRVCTKIVEFARNM